MEEGVGRDEVIEGLGTSLSIDGLLDIGELTEHIEAIELKEQIAVHEPFGEASVPDKIVGIHCIVAIASARVHGQVGSNLEIPRQFNLCGQTIVEVEDIDCGKVRPVAGGALVVKVALCREIEFVGRTPSKRKFIAKVVRLDNATILVHQVHAMVVCV